MTDLLLTPPIALLTYLGLAWLLYRLAGSMAEQSEVNEEKRSVYTGGEAPPARTAAPGYRPFFVIALFFAVLHLGVLMLGSSGLTPLSGLYLAGLLLALLALILG